MARTKAKRASAKMATAISAQKIIEATPERIALARSVNDDGVVDQGFEWISAAEIDPREQAINRVRRFRHTMLDRMHRKGQLTWVQWYAGDRYRETHALSMIEGAVCAAYGERTSSGEVSYGLPRTIGQLKARQRLREYRSTMPFHIQRFMDRFLIEDALPRYCGRAHVRQVTDIRKTLDGLAEYMRLQPHG